MNPTYLGAFPDQGLLVPMKVHDIEGAATLQCGGTTVHLSYTALHLISGWLAVGASGCSDVAIAGDIKKAFHSITCEASIGGRTLLPAAATRLFAQCDRQHGGVQCEDPDCYLSTRLPLAAGAA